MLNDIIQIIFGVGGFLCRTSERLSQFELFRALPVQRRYCFLLVADRTRPATATAD